MAFLDKIFKFKRKPFKKEAEKTEEKKVSKKESDEPRGSGKLAHVLVRPHISERSSGFQVLNKYVFEVEKNASKHDIARAVKDLYNINPIAVNIIKMRGKNIRFGKSSGSTKSWKKAIITLPKGKTIDIYQN